MLLSAISFLYQECIIKKILSIDGGGIRGIIPAIILSEIESKTGKSTAANFDLIAGTSTGGILALGLCTDDGSGKAQYSANDLADIYQKRGKEIFSCSLWKTATSLGGIADELYSHKGIEKVLSDCFDDKPLGSCLTKTMITSYDIRNRQPLFFKSWNKKHHSVQMKLVARATSAAPTYFEPALVTIEGSRKALIDGGVFINSPTISAYAAAKKLFPEETNFLVLSLGTGELIRPIYYSDAKDWGKAGWLLPLLNCIFDGVADAADYQMKVLLGKGYFRLQATLNIASDDLDNTTNGNIVNLIAEAKNLIQTRKTEFEAIYRLLAN